MTNTFIDTTLINGIKNFYNSDIQITTQLSNDLKNILNKISWGSYDNETQWLNDIKPLTERYNISVKQIESLISKLFWSTAFIQVFEEDNKNDLSVLIKNAQVMLPRTVDVPDILKNRTLIEIYVQKVGMDEEGYTVSISVDNQYPRKWELYA